MPIAHPPTYTLLHISKNTMIIKVCGMRDGGNIKAAIEAGADWIGMIFWPKSPRYVQMQPSLTGTLPDTAIESNVLQDGNDAPGSRKTKFVGVFVNDSAQNIITRIVNFNLDLVQLHGDESATFIRNVRATLAGDISPSIKFIKAISVSSATDLDKCAQYEGVVDYLLFDTKCADRGGSGKHFDWSLLENYHGSTPFLLSGGIDIDDADTLKSLNLPMMAGIDINSRFETEPGVKDISKIKTFINKLR